MSNSILNVEAVFDDKDSNEWILVCPHCGEVRGIEKEGSLSNLQGEQYQDNLCDGWYEISNNATASIKTVEELHKLSDDKIAEINQQQLK